MATRNRLREKIELYTRFILEGKVSPSSGYQDNIRKANEVLTLIKSGKMTPKIFSELDSHTKWDIANSKLLKDIVWCCGRCGNEQGKEPPHASIMDGSSIHCGQCEAMLTCRTGGGQNNPFNMTFKKITKTIKNK